MLSKFKGTLIVRFQFFLYFGLIWGNYIIQHHPLGKDCTKSLGSIIITEVNRTVDSLRKPNHITQL